MRTRLLAAFIAVIVFASLLAWHWGRAAHEAETAHLVLSQEILRQQEALRAAEAKLQSARARRETQRAPAAPASSLTAPQAGAAATSAPNPFEVLRDNPELQFLQLAARRAHLETVYGLLWDQLGLSTEQKERFRDLFVAREEQLSDLLYATSNKDAAVHAPAVGRLRAEIEVQHRTALRELLGDGSFSVFETYERAAPFRDTASALIGAATVSGLSFTQEQAESLARVLAHANGDYRNGRWANAAGIDWDTVKTEARGFLSDAQIEFILTNEPRGRGAGGRFLPYFHRAVNDAQQADIAASTRPQ